MSQAAKKHQLSDLYQMQSLPLESKINMTQRRIIEWYNHFNGDVYLSFSGGKDSTVLKHIIKSLEHYPIPSVFIDTGLEYPEIRDFVKQCKSNGDDIEIIRPTMTFRQVIEYYGYPVISKEVSRRVQYASKAIREGREKSHGDYLKLCGLFKDKNGNKSQFNCEKWKFLLDAPFHCSSECCTVMKKNPVKKYEKETGRQPILATMADESKRPTSKPMSFWTEQDVLEYIVKYNVPYASVYGKIYQDSDGTYKTTGCNRTGCVFCMFGCHLEKPVNRFQKLAETHPKLYNYCINGGEEINGTWKPNNQGLGLSKVLDYIGVDYQPVKELKPKKLFDLK